MKFFTPELYLRYNSDDDAEADQAESQWEAAIRCYRSHLKELAPSLPRRVKTLAEEVCLHDAEILALKEDAPDARRPLFPIPVGILSMKQGSEFANIVYILWDKIAATRPIEDWPFSASRPQWLYDEIDREGEEGGLYWQRILWSDGRVVAIPFVDVIVQSYSLRETETAILPRV